jgi:hypothetical protein
VPQKGIAPAARAVIVAGGGDGFLDGGTLR